FAAGIPSPTFAFLAFLAFLALPTLALLSGCVDKREDGYESFTLLMDALVGDSGNWSAGKHDHSWGVLTVEDVKVTPAREYQNSKLLVFEIGELKLDDVISSAELRKLLERGTHDSAKAVKIADGIEITDLKHAFPLFGKGIVEIGAKNLWFGKVGLSGALPDTPPGFLGFLKNLTLGDFAQEGFVIKTSHPDRKEVATFRLEEIRAEDLSFDGDFTRKTEDVWDVLSNLRMENGEFVNLELSYDSKLGKAKGSLKRLEVEDVRNLLSAGYLETSPMTFSAKGTFPGFPGFLGFAGLDGLPGFPGPRDSRDPGELKADDFEFGVRETTLENADFSPLFKKAGASGDAPERFDLAEAVFNFANLFTLPFSADSFVASGFRLKTGDKLEIGIKSVELDGPVKAREASNYSLSADNLRVAFKDADESAGGLPGALSKLGKILDKDSFELDFEMRSATDPKKNLTTYRHKADLDDLGLLMTSFALDGITGEFFDSLEKVGTSDPGVQNFSPALPLLLDVGIKEASARYEDDSLVKTLITRYREENGLSKSDFKKTVNEAFDVFLTRNEKQMASFDINTVFVDELKEFVLSPSSAVITVKPRRPIKAQNAIPMLFFRSPDVFKAWGVSVSVNGSSPKSLANKN
ncbi:MAG: hypothetical protein LBF41_04720, partial [Deltaproteobacteria bacterium]|nr:hypothetical protein [Deltaproteobacteria bacterium]